MNFDKLNEIISEIKASSLDDPQFHANVFTKIVKQNKAILKDELASCCIEEYDALSRRIDRSGLQESCSVRNVLMTRCMANFLIDNKGEIVIDKLSPLISHLKEFLYSLGPERQFDALRQEHILNVLQFLQSSKEAQRLIKNMTKPLSNPFMEDLIRATLQISSKEIIDDVHVRKAALSAWLCYLRQNVGSCFATAPAIIIHDEQPLQFLKDINEILNTGCLKRTFSGVEYIAPLSKSWGAGDLKKNIVVFNVESFNKLELWVSPGFIAAFEAIGIISSDLTLKQKIDVSKKIFKKLFMKRLQENSYFIINAEKIIRLVLLQHLNLSENDISEYENKSSKLSPSNMMMNAPIPDINRVKNRSSQTFQKLLESSESAFKAIADNALLKAWEFTLASFAETKASFTRWNLYSSLGLRPEDKGGIGPFMYEYLNNRLEQIKIKLHELQFEYEQIYSQVKYLEARMQRASSEKEMEWLKIDYKTKTYEFQTIEDLRDNENNKGQRIANLYDQLIDAYYELFPRYFQEVYDADMHEVSVGPYDDSPAGFRLLFKHGRANTSQWEYIHQPQEFIQALCTFFNAAERELINKEEFAGLEREFSDITTAIVTHIRTDEFLETAFYRMASAHGSHLIKDPLKHLEKIEKKPWAYTSGGTMGTLISCYFGLEDKPTETARWVENPMELLVFLVDTLKQMPPKLSQDFLKNPAKSMLIHSPTHAFLLKPGKKLFKESWQTDAFTYTWVRDNLIKPMVNAVEILLLDEQKQDFLIDRLSQKVNENNRFYFNRTFSKHFGVMSPIQWRNHLVENMEKEQGLQVQGYPVLSADEIDGFLFSNLPLLPLYQVKEGMADLLHALSKIINIDKNLFNQVWENLLESKGYSPYFTSKGFQSIFKAILCLILQKTSLPIDINKWVVEQARNHSYALPEPIIIADTNWIKEYFAFLINPGTGKLEFWRVDPLGTVGYPISAWIQWLNGTRKDITWGVYNRPYEYIK